ncbi:acylphosphatase [Liquorilactobacillus uvarum]|nr:acylphosphatase [Liquorilactobacillus uvarum]
MQAVKLHVYGRVQGVGFRYCTKMVADQLEISGIVRNEPDGSVYIEAQGKLSELETFIEKIKTSPTPSGKVEKLVITKIPPIDYSSFQITY